MRRVPLLALSLVLLSSCFYRPVFVDPLSGSGTLRPKLDARRPGVNLCREVRRVQCDTENCGAAGRDFVTFKCSTGPITRCEIGKGCS